MTKAEPHVSLVFAAAALAFACLVNAQDFRDTTLPIDRRVSALLSQLTLAEKISLIPTDQPAIPRLDIAARRIGNEGLHGVAYQLATVFPQAIAFAHTWNPDLIRQVGSAVGDEARVYARRDWSTQGLNYFSPVVDLARDPRWGRVEESYGEDPYISGTIGGAYVSGMQGDDPHYLKIVPTLKHFAANSLEDNRTSGSSNVDPRNLREYYLKPFELITRQAHVQSYMAAFNSINFLPCAVTNLFRDVTRAEWGFHGFVVTDAWLPSFLMWGHNWVPTGAQAITDILKAGVDSVLDANGLQYLQDAVSQGLLSESDLDRALRNNLRVRFLTGEFDPPAQVSFNSIPDSALMSGANSALARRTGREAVVLLKNNPKLLPLDASKLKNVAVIGPLADVVLRDWYGGYMAYAVSPRTGIQAKLGPSVKVSYAEGAPRIALKIHGGRLWVTAGAAGTSPLTAASSTIGDSETFVAQDWGWGCTTLRSVRSGMYVEANSAGQFVPDSTVAYSWVQQFCFSMVPQASGGVQLQYYDDSDAGAGADGTIWYGLGGTFDVQTVEDGGQAAAVAAAGADLAIVAVGNNTTINGKEGHDRPDIILPPAMDQMIQSVYAANPNTVVVVVSSYPMSIPWEDAHVPAILYTGHGGQELGNYLADVLFGDYNPGGRLAMTWYKSMADIPPMADYDIRNGRTYQYFTGTPLYPFGYGLSYTSFQYSNLKLTPAAVGPADTLTASVDVQNSGSRAGDEVVQLYTHFNGSKVQRPLEQLRRFQRVTLQPGETRTVSFSLPLSETAVWDVRQSRFVVEPGTMDIRVGASSVDIRTSGSVAVNGEVLPPRNAFSVQRAENFDYYAGAQLVQAGDGGQAIQYQNDGGWVSFDEVDFGTGVNAMVARVSSGGQGGAIEAHLDRADGPIAATCSASGTGGAQTWSTASCGNVQASGIHTLYLMFHGNGPDAINLEWFVFTAGASVGPAIDPAGVKDAAAFSPTLSRGSWASIFGENLAVNKRPWSSGDFVNGLMPLSLDGTSVQVNGVNAPVSYISPTQVNFQVPTDAIIGGGVVQASSPAGASAPVPVTIVDQEPAFFTWLADGRTWVAAQHADFSLIGLSAGRTPAKAGETIILWGSGFGQTWPPVFSGAIVSVPEPLADPGGLTVSIGGQPAAVKYAGITIAGTYQLNVVVPSGLAAGQYPVTASVNGVQSVGMPLLAVQ